MRNLEKNNESKPSILLISYGIYEYDGRLRSLIKVFSELGVLNCFLRGEDDMEIPHAYCNESYFRFICEAVKYAKTLQSIDFLVLDNRKATIPGMIIQRIVKPKKVIQDCRELYLLNETHHLTGKIGCIFESISVKRSDIVIAANEERALIMKKKYSLKNKPLVYENLRRLQYSSESERKDAEKKFSHLIRNDEFRILSSSGCNISRTNEILISNSDRITYPCRLIFVGENTEEDLKVVNKIIKEKQLKNIEIIGRVNQDELKYLIENSHIGIVNYHQKDTNNRLCASGKLYEFIYEGIPVVTTTNPPLKSLCEECNIGCCDNDYYGAINEVLENYNEFKNNVDVFAKSHTIKSNDETFKLEIINLLEYVDIK